MPWDIKWKSGKLLVILTAVHWNILDGGVIVFLISSVWVCVYLFTCSVNKDSLCCDLLPTLHSPTPSPHTQLRMKNPFELWEQPQICLYWRKEHYSRLSRQFKDTDFHRCNECILFFTNKQMWTYKGAKSCFKDTADSTLMVMYSSWDEQMGLVFNRESYIFEADIMQFLICQ